MHSNTGLTQETRKISNSLTSHLEELEKEEQMKPKNSGRKEILKIGVEKKWNRDLKSKRKQSMGN